MKLVVASVNCHVEERLDSFCVSLDSPVRIRVADFWIGPRKNPGMISASWKWLGPFLGGAEEANVLSFG